MIETDSSTREGSLNGRGNAIGVAIGGNGDWSMIVHLHQCRIYILSDCMGVASPGHLTILYIPPHRCFCRLVLRFHRFSTGKTRLQSVSGHRLQCRKGFLSLGSWHLHRLNLNCSYYHFFELRDIKKRRKKASTHYCIFLPIFLLGNLL